MWEFTTGRWSSGPVAVALGPLERSRGLIPRARNGLVLRGRSVHGIGMSHALLVVGLSGCRVSSVHVLPPAGVVVDPAATAFLELEPWRDAPPLGAVLRVRRIR